MTIHCQCDVCLELAAEVSAAAAQESLPLQITQDTKDAREDNRLLQDVNHFHNFIYDRCCACGFSEVEYLYRELDNDIELMCPLARAQHVESPSEFFASLMSKWTRKPKQSRCEGRGRRSGGKPSAFKASLPTISESTKAYGRKHSVSTVSHSEPDLAYMYRDNYSDSFENVVRLYEQGENFKQ